MNSNAGLWIDHRTAFIVFLGATRADAELTERMESGLEKRVRYSGQTAENSSAENQRDRQFETHLNLYYDRVIDRLSDAQSILIMGPGEAKGELKKRFMSKNQGERVVGVDTVDKLTDGQIVAHVRAHYAKGA